MSKHHPDLIMCRRQPGIAIGRLCEKCDGKWYVLGYFAQQGTPTDLRQIAPSVIPTYAPRPLFASVTNATLALTEDDASFAGLLVSPTPTIVRSVHD
ncbi:PHD finger-like domain-containing protein 5B [Trametes pubescens]|uniref:PHD finger-like domain-containing protein 5B n=1 Tax=Trametes pubescens TaxID=154538 RepID=A0A1M2VQ89_TRAPU|nr:PHD finger-like domain-containing protein 5B [Trametes pubescens]